MGLAKKKAKKQLKIDEDELMEQVHHTNRQKNDEKLKAQVGAGSLFTENKGKEGLKEKREKLKADRFKQEQHSKASKVDEMLIKRYATKQARRETKGLEPVQKKAAVTNRKFNETEDFGELEDIWAKPSEVYISPSFQKYKNFAKSSMNEVKTVILPKGGQSYNPSIKDHRSLLKELAVVEEK